MKFKEYLLNETVVTYVKQSGKSAFIHKNPTSKYIENDSFEKEDGKRYKTQQFRGLITKNGDYYMWNSYILHDFAIKALIADGKQINDNDVIARTLYNPSDGYLWIGNAKGHDARDPSFEDIKKLLGHSNFIKFANNLHTATPKVNIEDLQ